MERLLLNGSGIKDPTPYNAIKKVEPVSAGEIYKSGKSIFMVVNCSQNGMYCPALKLLDKEPFDVEEDRWTKIVSTSGNAYYTDVSMMQYLTTHPLKRLIDTVEDLSDLKDRIADSLGIRVRIVEEPKEAIPDSIYKKLYEDLLDRLIKARNV